MGADQPRWYRGGKRQRAKDGDAQVELDQTMDNSQPPTPTPVAHEPSTAVCNGAMVARSQILVTGSTATLLGTMTNETSCDVHFSGTPPYALTLDTDGSRPVLLGDFNSPPRERPSCADWVIHPGASVPYRSLPVTLQTPDPRWDGTDWSASSQSTTLDVTMLRCQGELPTIQIIS